MNYREALESAGKYDDELKCTDPRFRRSVQVFHEDGSHFKWMSAFLMQKDEWLFVFTEHFSYFVFAKDDLLWFSELSILHEEVKQLP